MLVVLVTAGGELELRTLRRGLHTSKANATEIVDTLERRRLVRPPPARARPPRRRRRHHAARPGAGRAPVPGALVPRRARAFAPLDDDEKRTLVELCRKLAAT